MNYAVRNQHKVWNEVAKYNGNPTLCYQENPDNQGNTAAEVHIRVNAFQNAGQMLSI